LGTCYLDLAQNLSEDVSEFSKDLVLSLDKCADVDAELHLTIHSKPIIAIKMESKNENEEFSQIGSFSEGHDEPVDSLEDGLEDSNHAGEPTTPREKSGSVLEKGGVRPNTPPGENKGNNSNEKKKERNRNQ